jgi:NDP-sugar pyrophosphorylase family protein
MKFVKAILLLESGKTFSKTTGDMPAVLVDVLGKTTLARTVENLSRLGLGDITVVAEKPLADSRVVRESVAGANLLAAPNDQLWRAAEQQFESAAEDSTHILIVRLNAYAELDFEELLEHHRSQGNKVTRVFFGSPENQRALDIFLVNSSRRNDAAFLLRSEMENARTGTPFLATAEKKEYVNFLQHEADLRQLASDALHRVCKMQPAGTELRPGIWAATDSHIDKRARLVAPIFIGSRARICPGAVVTRGSSIERHSVVGNKTVVENGTILPYTNLGPGLDVSHSLVGARHIFNLQRNVCTPIQDPKLLSEVPASAGARTLFSMAKLLIRIPGQIWRGKGVPAPAPVAESTVSYKEVFDSAQNPQVEMPKAPPALAAMRRYGNQ